jgi:hypothetical protein
MASSNTNPSICIPRVFPNITREKIKDTFKELKLGIIERIDMIQRANEKGEKFQRVFIHFKYWFQTNYAENVKTKLIKGHNIKIVYDEPWFWKVSMSQVAKPNFQEKTKQVLGSGMAETTKLTGQRKPRLTIDISSIERKERMRNTSTPVQSNSMTKNKTNQLNKQTTETNKEKSMVEKMKLELIEQKNKIEKMLKDLDEKIETQSKISSSHPFTPLQNEKEERIQRPQAPKATKSFDRENRNINLKPRKLFDSV